MITEGWLRSGGTALEPVEFYTDPHRRQGPRPEHDLSQPHVQAKYFQEVEADDTNVEWLACPCTTFCDWNLQNNGTRTFQNPMGAPNEKEDMGNKLAIFEANCLRRHWTEVIFLLRRALGGRAGPQDWHLPRGKRSLQRPDVDFLEVEMCAYG